MTQHTAENIFPQIEGCTCTILGLRSLRDTIRLCPLHRAAPDLLAALKAIFAARDNYHGGDLKRAIDAARPLIAKAEEGS